MPPETDSPLPGERTSRPVSSPLRCHRLVACLCRFHRPSRPCLHPLDRSHSLACQLTSGPDLYNIYNIYAYYHNYKKVSTPVTSCKRQIFLQDLKRMQSFGRPQGSLQLTNLGKGLALRAWREVEWQWKRKCVYTLCRVGNMEIDAAE